jgi:hypothetical protein
MMGSDEAAARNEAASAGANVLLVLSQFTAPRHDFDCPSSSPSTDCPPSEGAWFRVVFESYVSTPDALRELDASPGRPRPRPNADIVPGAGPEPVPLRNAQLVHQEPG